MNLFKKLFGNKSKPVVQPPEPIVIPSYPNPYIGKKNPFFTQLVQAHKNIQPFDYNLTVLWAISLIEEGNETPEVLMLASFVEPFDSFEISPYISRVLAGLALPELEGDNATRAVISYYCVEILKGNALRSHLKKLIDIYFKYYERELGLNNLYLLGCAWDDLGSGYEMYYYDGATKNNIEDLAKMEAANWLATHYPTTDN